MSRPVLLHRRLFRGTSLPALMHEGKPHPATEAPSVPQPQTEGHFKGPSHLPSAVMVCAGSQTTHRSLWSIPPATHSLHKLGVLHIVMKPALHTKSRKDVLAQWVPSGSISVRGTGFISHRAPHSCPRVRCADLHVVNGPSIHHGDRSALHDLQSHGTRASLRLEGGLGGLPHH